LRQPTLKVIAGCNGSGKSTFSQAYVDHIVPFDYDKRFMENYNSLLNIDIRWEMAKNMTIQQFEKEINSAFDHKENFCYETNFDSNPMVWPKKAKELGYKVELIFFCLDRIELAKKRVSIRVANEGHLVPYNIIEYKWKEGYKNLNLYYEFFDYVLLVDNSSPVDMPKNIFELDKNEPGVFDVSKFTNELPEYAKRRFPEIFSLIENE